MPSVGMAIAQPSPSRDTTHCRHRRLNPQDELAYLSRLFAGIAIKTLKRSGRLVQTFCRNWGLTTGMMRLEDFRGLGFRGTCAYRS
jgi:hypothetical protein